MGPKNKLEFRNQRKNGFQSSGGLPFFCIAIFGGVLLLLTVPIFDSGPHFEKKDKRDKMEPIQQGEKTASPDDEVFNVDQYRCSSYHLKKVNLLKPKGTEKKFLNEQEVLSRRLTELELLDKKINSSSVNEYSSQGKIDNFNKIVNEYNAKLKPFKQDAIRFDSKIDSFNRQSNVYNNYLIINCKPKR